MGFVNIGPLELLVIFVVLDGGELLAELTEPVTFGAERAVDDQRLDDIDLADRDEMLAVSPAALVLRCLLIHPSTQANGLLYATRVGKRHK